MLDKLYWKEQGEVQMDQSIKEMVESGDGTIESGQQVVQWALKFHVVHPDAFTMIWLVYRNGIVEQASAILVHPRTAF